MRTKILVINGPNLNLLGTREPEIYGRQSLEELISQLSVTFPEFEIHDFQSNIEGEIIDQLQAAVGRFDGILLNAGGYSHTSVSIRDAITAINVPVVEIHLSNIAAREEFRRVTILAAACVGSISGFGANSYQLGVMAIKTHLEATH